LSHAAGFVLAAAGPAEADRIARLHAESWRATYRDIASGPYLDGPVYAERAAFWRARMQSQGGGRRLVLLATRGREDAGFMCTFLDGDGAWGAALDNLHVLPRWQGHGLGRRLMSEAARFVLERAPGKAIFLMVYERNVAARAFYDAMGGENVERVLDEKPGGGGTAWTLRYLWKDPARLL
jgi:ribosomal protein S18 acetylase RimI-like enzyme